MKPNQRLDTMEKTIAALKLIIERQNENHAEYAQRLAALEARLGTPTENAYKPLFDRWPGNVR